jgi:hypothetical protein
MCCGLPSRAAPAFQRVVMLRSGVQRLSRAAARAAASSRPGGGAACDAAAHAAGPCAAPAWDPLAAWGAWLQPGGCPHARWRGVKTQGNEARAFCLTHPHTCGTSLARA